MKNTQIVLVILTLAMYFFCSSTLIAQENGIILPPDLATNIDYSESESEIITKYPLVTSISKQHRKIECYLANLKNNIQNLNTPFINQSHYVSTFQQKDKDFAFKTLNSNIENATAILQVYKSCRAYETAAIGILFSLF